MNSIARFSRVPMTVAKRAAVSRTFVSSAKACGGAKHDAHDDHDDHEHHEHPLWEKIPFSKGGVGAFVFGGAAVGAGLIMLACSHQQKKGGFSS